MDQAALSAPVETSEEVSHAQGFVRESKAEAALGDFQMMLNESGEAFSVCGVPAGELIPGPGDVKVSSIDARRSRYQLEQEGFTPVVSSEYGRPAPGQLQCPTLLGKDAGGDEEFQDRRLSVSRPDLLSRRVDTHLEDSDRGQAPGFRETAPTFEESGLCSRIVLDPQCGPFPSDLFPALGH